MKEKNNIYKKGIISSSLLSLIAKGVAFIQQISIVYCCGVSSTTDIHFYLYNLAILIGGMIQIITSSILIPRSMEMRINKSHISEMKYLNSFFILLIGIGILGMFLLGIIGKVFMTLITNFNLEDIQHNYLIYLLFLPTTLLLSINSFLAEIFVSYKYFTAPIILNLGLNLCIILSVLLFHNQIGGFSMMAGALSLAFIAFISFIYKMKQILHWNFRIWNFKLLKTSFQPILGLIANQSIVIIVSTYPFYLLSQLPIGSVSIVNYAMKLIQAPYGIMQQIAIVLQVKLNELHAQKKESELYNITQKIARNIFIIGLIIAILTYAMRHPIIHIIYGLANIPTNAMLQLSTIIGIGIFSLPLIGSGQVWVKLYFTQRRIKTYIYTMTIMNFISCGIYHIFILYFQISGYAIAYTLAESLMAIALWYKIKKTDIK